MPAASASTRLGARASAGRGAARGGRPRQPAGRPRGPAARVRWDRLGRLALLCVLVALVYLYVSAGFHLLSTVRQSHHDKAAVAAMEREYGQLLRQRQALSGQPALESQARRLGMVRPGERSYLVGPLPDN
jgi:hypothetical protein